MIELGSKLPDVGTTIFTVMTRLAEQHGATNLSQGFPDFDPPRRLIDLVVEQLRAGRNQYAPMIGAAELRTAIADKLATHYGIETDAEDELTVTAGATQALFCAIEAVVAEGDEVIIFDPAYDSYEPAITLANGRTVHVPLTSPEFGIDWDRLESALNDRTRMIIVNSPHNPSGALLSAEDYDQLAELLRPFRCFVLSDEVYEHVVFDGRTHATVLQQTELRERAFVVSSFGKTYHATGWKVGYCVAPKRLTDEFRSVYQFVMFATVAPIQYALAQFIRECPEHYRGLPDFYQSKRDYFVDAMGDTKFGIEPAGGTYFQLADYSAISDLDDVEFARWLTIEHGVATIPISVFYRQPPPAKLVRFCFAKDARTIDEAALRLRAL